jgi:hypothetical protein
MELFVTVGNIDGESQELVFDVPVPITYIGIEVEDNSPDADKTGRMTIMRYPFINHGTTIHTICSLVDGSVRSLEM